MNNNTYLDSLFTQLCTTLRAAFEAEAKGNVDGAQFARDEARRTLEDALRTANSEGREEAREAMESGEGDDPAERFDGCDDEVGFNPYMGERDDDC